MFCQPGPHNEMVELRVMGSDIQSFAKDSCPQCLDPEDAASSGIRSEDGRRLNVRGNGAIDKSINQYQMINSGALSFCRDMLIIGFGSFLLCSVIINIHLEQGIATL